MKISRLSILLGSIPLLVGLVSTLFFVVQGGFGAGHGRFDLIVAINALFLDLFGYESMPLPRFVKQHDILLIVWLPAIVNSAAFFLFGFLMSALGRPSGKAVKT